MSRENKGRFAKGFSGNRKGRPREAKRTFTTQQVRKDFLFAMEEKFSFSVDGKVQKLPASRWINKQLVRKAVSGETRCILKAIEIQREMIAEMVNERLSLLQTYLEEEKHCKAHPEDVTDEMLEHIRYVRELLDADDTLH